MLHLLLSHAYLHRPYNLNADWQIEPFAIVRKTDNSPLFYDAAALVKYKQKVWCGATYRKSNIGISIGTVYDRFILNYS